MEGFCERMLKNSYVGWFQGAEESLYIVVCQNSERHPVSNYLPGGRRRREGKDPLPN